MFFAIPLLIDCAIPGRTLDRDFIIHKTAGHLVDGAHGGNRDMPLNLFDQAVMKLDIALMLEPTRRSGRGISVWPHISGVPVFTPKALAS